jgi:hypothetical protein
MKKFLTAGAGCSIGAMTFVLLLTSGGCARDQVLEQARALGREVRVYRQAQAGRIEQLNADYRDAFAQNLDELLRLSDTELNQNRDVDAQTLVDQMTEGDKATFFGALRGRLAGNVAAHRKSIDAADQAIAVARDNYLKSYKEAKLQLVKLDQLQADLTILGEREDASRVAGVLIQKLVENYRQIQEEQKQQAGQENDGGNAGNGA